MKYLAVIFSIVVATLFVPAAGGQYYQRQVQAYPTYQIVPIYQYQFIPRLVDVPVYSATYSESGQSVDPFLLAETYKELKILNDTIRQTKFEEIEYVKGDKQQLVGLLDANCSSCHTGGKAKKKFQIFNDQHQFVFSHENVLKILDRAYIHKDMPPNQPLRLDELKVLTDGVSLLIRNGEK